MQTNSRFYRWLRRHPLPCFLLMTASFVAFGYLTVDLIHLLSSNANFVLNYGWLALDSGGLQQLGELCLTALLAMAFYLLFKLCEEALIQRIAKGKQVVATEAD